MFSMLMKILVFFMFVINWSLPRWHNQRSADKDILKVFQFLEIQAVKAVFFSSFRAPYIQASGQNLHNPVAVGLMSPAMLAVHKELNFRVGVLN